MAPVFYTAMPAWIDKEVSSCQVNKQRTVVSDASWSSPV